MSNCAAAILFVKDERNDIMSWISWYFALGFDKIYIYDDHSTDGTYEICKAASNILNIQIEKTDLEQENFYFRQRDSYYKACKMASGQYDWVILVDADEYLYLDSHNNIHDFLGEFDESISGIALNWKIYGSSGKVLKDNIPTYEAFCHRSDHTLNDNTLVKSIIRPERLEEYYENPHKYNFISGDYVDALGEKFDWLPGATKSILWEKAWINHYICRSMEHYADRIRRRIGVDLSNTTAYWDHFNQNTIYEKLSTQYTEKANLIMDSIKSETIKFVINDICLTERNISYPDSKNLNIKKNTPIYDIYSFHGGVLSINNIDGHMVQSNSEYNVNILIDTENKKGFFLRIKNDTISNIKFHIFEDNRKKYMYLFDIEYIDEKNIFLRSSESKKYLTSFPKDHSDKVECSRIIANDWEKFKIVDTGKKINMSLGFDKKIDLSKFKTIISNSFGDLSVNEFIILFNLMNEYNKKLLVLNSKEIISWLL